MARRPTDSVSFVDTLEDIEIEAAEWARDIEDSAVRALMPDGRPFGMEPRSEREQMIEYRALRGSQEAWQRWLENLQMQVDSQLAKVSPEYSAGVNGVELVRRYASAYSAKMERMMEREQVKAKKVLEPAIAEVPFGDEEDDGA